MPFSHKARKLTETLILVILTLSCGKSKPEGFRVVSYDALTHRWTIIRTGYPGGIGSPYVTKRLVAVCSFRSHSNRAPVRGPEACSLDVGRLYTPNAVNPKTPDDYVFTSESFGELQIAVGPQADREWNFFDILKNEVVPEATES